MVVYMIDGDGFYIRVGDVDDVFVASRVDDFVVVDGIVCMYESCLGALHNLSRVIIIYVFGGCCEW